MRKYIIYILVMILTFSVIVASAASGDAVGYIYSTDILAYVHGAPIDGYNIGGKTVIIAEDLASYGFQCEYDDAQRTLTVNSTFYGWSRDIAEIPRGTVGNIVGNIYETDIKVMLNGMEIRGYNIGGRTAICLEDMGELQGSPNADYGYSKYLGKTVWDAENRTISFDSYVTNQEFFTWNRDFNRIVFTFADNVIYVWNDDMQNIAQIGGNSGGDYRPDPEGRTYFYSEGFETQSCVLKPLYISAKGEKCEIGTVMCFEDTLSDRMSTYLRVEDKDAVAQFVAKVREPQMTYTEAYSFFAERYSIDEFIENNDYAVMTLVPKPEGQGAYIVALKKSGGYAVIEDYSIYTNPDIKLNWENAEMNVVEYQMPFAGPHGATTLYQSIELNNINFE